MKWDVVCAVSRSLVLQFGNSGELLAGKVAHTPRCETIPYDPSEAPFRSPSFAWLSIQMMRDRTAELQTFLEGH